jgi:hypothetical protein
VDFWRSHAYTATGAAFIERVSVFIHVFQTGRFGSLRWGTDTGPSNSLKAYQMEVKAQFLTLKTMSTRYSWFGMCDGPGSAPHTGLDLCEH